MSDDTPKPPPDPADDARMMELAGKILDGGSVDWNAADSLADELRALGTLARLGTAPAPGPHGEWGPLRLLERVGEGTFGEVFRAWDTRLDREVALKLLRTERSQSGHNTTVIAEGRLLARVRHPNVVTVFGAEQIDGRIGIWTEFVHGSTLQESVEKLGPMTAKEAATVGRVLCTALAAIHSAGVVHGDVKAQNVLREPGGRLVLVDLGTGREHLPGPGATAGPISGTPLYMAPELWSGASPTPQSDIYSLGVLLYFLITGAHPVPGATADDVREAHAACRRVPLRDREPGVTAAFAAAVERALDPNAGARYQSADEFTSALVATARAPRRRVTTAIGVVAAVSMAGVSYYYGPRDAAPAPGSTAARETMTRLLPPPGVFGGRPARDGRHFPFVDGKLNLWLWDRRTDTSNLVVAHDGGDPEVADWSLASPDGRRIAYASGAQTHGYELRIVNRDGSGSRTVLERGAARDFEPVDWSWDGRYILCWLNRPAGFRDLALIPADGGPRQVLQTVRAGAHAGASFSPDGRFVVYEAHLSENQTDRRRHLLITATRTGAVPRVLTGTGTDDHSPHWTASGDVVFASVTGRQTSLFLMRMTNGEPRGPAEPIAVNLNLRNSLALSESGILFFQTLRDSGEVYIAPVDLSRGFSIGKPAPVDPSELDGHANGKWSPNGLSYAYIDRTLGALMVKDLVSRTSTTTIRPELSWLGNEPPTWSPDGRFVLMRGRGLDSREGFFRIEVQTGRTEAVVQFDGGYGQYEWRPDGRAIRYRHLVRGVEDRDLESGRESLVVGQDELGAPAGLGTSFDGRWLLVGSREGTAVLLKLWNLRDRSQSARVVARLGTDSRFSTWTPDSKHLLYVERQKPGQPFYLWMLALDGSPPRNLGQLPGYGLVNARVTIHPNGSELTYMQGTFGSRLYMLENFLRQGQ
jgi:Tol biopolymer transport system component